MPQMDAIEDTDGCHAPGRYGLNTRPGPAENLHGTGDGKSRNYKVSPAWKFRIRRSRGRMPAANSVAT